MEVPSILSSMKVVISVISKNCKLHVQSTEVQLAILLEIISMAEPELAPH